MRYPAFLKENGRIGFIAPSFGAGFEPYCTLFEGALARFEEMGYQIVLGPNAFRCEGIGKSSTAEKCAQEINDFFTQDLSDVILSVGGGETMCEDLSFVDFDAIRQAEPKWFLGYSDNTNLVFPLTTLCDTAAIYGPCAPSFGMNPLHPSLQDALSILKGEKLTVRNYPAWELDRPENIDIRAPYVEQEPFLMTAFVPQKSSAAFSESTADSSENGAASQESTAAFLKTKAGLRKAGPEEDIHFSGRLLGGCLDCLQTLCGTRFDAMRSFNQRYAQDGVVWFLESCDLTPMSIRRVLWQMKEAGWFDCARGFLIGRPLHYNESFMGMDRINAVTGALSDLHVPILMDLDIGHLPPQMPLISGSMAEVTAKGNSISIDMRLL